MYGSRPYGTSSYGSISVVKPHLVFSASAFSITSTVHDPAISTVELVNNLEIGASLIAPTVNLTPRGVIVKVNDVDISNQVLLTSLNVSNNLYSYPDTADFEIIISPNKTYTPSAGDEILITDTGAKIFGGILIKQSKQLQGFSDRYFLEFKDWTEELGTILVDEVYTNETVEDIVADIFTNGDLSDYDGTTNVSDTTNVARIAFDNITVAEALDRLSGLSDKHWYVNPDKEIYLFDDSSIQAPFDLTDDNGNYDYSSLIIDEDLTQIRNRVTVKGKGIPAVTVEDATSISTYGLREYFNRDDEINATNEATQKANAYLTAYKDPVDIVNFETQREGLYSGQQINIDSTLRGFSKTLNIETVRFRSTAPNRFSYFVKATSQRLGGIDNIAQTVENPNDTTPSISDQGNLQDVEFTAIDDETISWSTGTIRLADGTSYSISAKTSQVLTADHVIYLDPDTSTTVLQISTNFADGIGQGKIPLAYATKSPIATKGADIFPVSFGQQIQLDGSVHITDRSIIADNIAANAITANEIAANTITASEIVANTITTTEIAARTIVAGDIAVGNVTATEIATGTITADKMNVTQLSAIAANIGSVTSGTITGTTLQTTVSGAGWRVSATDMSYYDGTDYPFVVVFTNSSPLGDQGDVLIGTGATNNMTWDDSAGALLIRGGLNADDVTAGTLTGRTVQSTASGSGAKVVMNASTNKLQFLYDNNEKGFIEATAGGEIKIDGDSSVHIIADGAGDDIYLHAGTGDLELDSDQDIYLFADRDVQIACDDLLFAFNDDNDGSDCYWFSDGAEKMKLTSAGNWSVQGDGHIVGTLSKGGGSFKIDHPLKPKTHILRHSFAESPEQMNIYKGRAEIKNGKCEVQLPDYFNVLNKDIEYNLTPIGKPANLYIKKEVRKNRFEIGSNVDCRFSWVVYGVRQDKFAKANPIIVEERKEVDGYIHPELFNSKTT